VSVVPPGVDRKASRPAIGPRRALRWLARRSRVLVYVGRISRQGRPADQAPRLPELAAG